jgi:hypothetical protein
MPLRTTLTTLIVQKLFALHKVVGYHSDDFARDFIGDDSGGLFVLDHVLIRDVPFFHALTGVSREFERPLQAEIALPFPLTTLFQAFSRGHGPRRASLYGNLWPQCLD